MGKSKNMCKKKKTEHILYLKTTILTDLYTHVHTVYTLTVVCVPPLRFSDRRSCSQAVPWPHGRVSGHRYTRGRGGKAQVRRKQSRSKQQNALLISHHMTVCVPASATGWLTMKAVLCAVRLDPCGGWNLSESGDCPSRHLHNED